MAQLKPMDAPSFRMRVAIWRTNEQRCFFCAEPVMFRNMEIDHLIPRVVNEVKLSKLIASLELPVDFHVDDTLNLVPTHGDCNRRKGATEFSEGSLRFFIETWRSKQARLRRELEWGSRAAENEAAILTLALRIEDGKLSLPEAIATLESLCGRRDKTNEPWVVTFGLSFADLPLSSTAPYAALCDRLESELASYLRELKAIGRQTEASVRNGETLSIRYAFWNLDLNSLDKIYLDRFEVLEVAPYAEIYNDSWDGLFPRAVVDTYKRVITDEKDPKFGLGRCPKCGSGHLNRSSGEDPRLGYYYFIECEDCHWSDWSQ
jgi:hypothetical protein